MAKTMYNRITVMYTPHLRHRHEFEEALRSYHMSAEGRSVLAETPLVLLVAPTSAGRNTIIRELLKKNDYHYIASDTSRPPRINDGMLEQNGVEYFFRKEEDMLRDVRAGHYIGVAIIHDQQVSGLNIREIIRAKEAGKIPITDVEVQGCKEILTMKPDAKPVFILPPSFDIWLERIMRRGKIAPIELYRRLESAVLEFEIALNDPRFTFIINDDFHEAVEAFDVLVRKGERDAANEERATGLAQELYHETIAYLAQHAKDYHLRRLHASTLDA